MDIDEQTEQVRATEDQDAAPVVEETGASAPVDPESLQRQLAELQDRNLRLVADARNIATRTQREKAEAIRFAEADFARELLVILDDLERNHQAALSSGNEAFADGVRITYEHFLKVLADRGIQPISALGTTFDPDRHEAVLQQPSTEHPPGTVVQELARGYTMHERVIRASRVIVSSGPPT